MESKRLISRPLKSMALTAKLTEAFEVDSPGITAWRKELPHVGVLMGLRIRCKRGRKRIMRVRLEANHVDYIFDLPWPIGKRREMYIPCGAVEAPDLVGITLQTMSSIELAIVFGPGKYPVEFQASMEYVPVPMLAK